MLHIMSIYYFKKFKINVDHIAQFTFLNLHGLRLFRCFMKHNFPCFQFRVELSVNHQIQEISWMC
jgi:hypothetical protein